MKSLDSTLNFTKIWWFFVIGHILMLRGSSSLNIHYGQRGLRIYRESSWCEIDRGLAQVTQVKPRILAVQLLTLSTPSRYCETSLRWKLFLFLTRVTSPNFFSYGKYDRGNWLISIHIPLYYKWSWLLQFIIIEKKVGEIKITCNYANTEFCILYIFNLGTFIADNYRLSINLIN